MPEAVGMSDPPGIAFAREAPDAGPSVPARRRLRSTGPGLFPCAPPRARPANSHGRGKGRQISGFLQEETTYAVCLDFFRDPVTILSCGHNFCRRCLSRCAAGGAACLQCRVPFPHGGDASGQPSQGISGFCPSRQLANVVAGMQTLAPLPAQDLCHRHLTVFCHCDGVLVCTACMSIVPTPLCCSRRLLAATGSINPFSLQKQFEASQKTLQEEDK